MVICIVSRPPGSCERGPGKIMAMVHGVYEDRLHVSVVEPLPREIHPYWGLLALALVFFIGIGSALGWATTRPKYETLAPGTVGSARQILKDEHNQLKFERDQVIVFRDHAKTIIVPYATKTPRPAGEAVSVSYNPADPYEYVVYDTDSFQRAFRAVLVLAALLGAWGSLWVAQIVRRKNEEDQRAA